MKKESTLIKALVFDVDGVVIGGEKFSERLEREYGISVEQTAEFFTGDFHSCLVGNLDLKQGIAPYLEGWGWNDGIEKFLKYWFSEDVYLVDAELVDHIQEYRSNGIKCYLATNQEKYRTEHLLNEAHFSELFDGMFASFDVGFKKPKDFFYDRMANRLCHLQRHEILFWDDSPENVVSARRQGINAEMYSSFTDFKRRIKMYQFLKE